MSYIKLVNFEVKRFLKLFVALIVFVSVAQIIAAVSSAWSYNNRAETIMFQEKLLMNDYVSKHGNYSMVNFLNEGLFQMSIAFAAAVLIIYVFFIWYRDWFGKSSFIYRLLMLPTERRHIYFAKLTTILLFVFVLLGVQVLLIEVAELIVKSILPAELYAEQGVIFTYSYDVLAILFPQSMLGFLLSYGIGTALVATLFTAILLERSFHLKGIILAGIYITLSQAFLFTPILLDMNTNYFYMSEILRMFVVTALIIFIAAILLANYLLKRKIHV